MARCCRRQDSDGAAGPAEVGWDAGEALDGGDGSDHVFGLDYDYLRPHAAAVKVAHPLMLRAIAVAKKKNDRIDAGRIADCLRCDFLPECYMAPMEIRERRRTLRYRKLLVRQNVQLKNKIAQLLMESGVSYNKEKLHQQGYFHKILPANPEIDPSLWPLLKLAREMIAA